MADDEYYYDLTSTTYYENDGVWNCEVTEWLQTTTWCRGVSHYGSYEVVCETFINNLWEDRSCTLVDIENPDPGEDPSCEGTSCESCEEGANPFSVHDGNARRRAVDLTVAGAAKGQLVFVRHHNTNPRHTDPYFGIGGNWRHNWMFTLDEYEPAGSDRPWRDLVYPEGLRRVFRPTEAGTWAPLGRFEETMEVVADGVVVTTPNGSRLHFVKAPQARVRYDMVALTDPHGLVTRLAYDADGKLLKVTEPAGRFLDFGYTTAAFKFGGWPSLATIERAPAPGVWTELTVPASVPASRYLRITSRLDGPLAVAEVQFLAADGAVLPGRATGSGVNAQAAFDGDPQTAFNGARREGNRLIFDLGEGQARTPAKIRVLAAPGQEAALQGVRFNALVTPGSTWAVLSSVTGSDGQQVEFAYTPVQDPATDAEFLALAAAIYDDGTMADYRYEVQMTNDTSRCVLVEADDPRCPDKAKRIRYTYDGPWGMIHQKINPVTGGTFATLERDPADPDKRIVRYSDLRQIVYRTPAATNGRPTERIDGLGRKTRFEYDGDRAQGRLKARIDHDGRRTEYTRDAQARITAEHRSEPGAAGQRRPPKAERQIARDAQGRVTSIADRRGRVATRERDGQGRITRAVEPGGAAREFTYDDLGRMLSIKERDGGLHRFTYNERGLKAQSTDPRGGVTRYGYDARGRLTEIVDPLGRVSRSERNARGLVTKITAPDGRTRLFAYDTYGRKTAETDELGRTQRFAYDQLDRITRTEDSTGGVTLFDYATLPKGCSSCSLAQNASQVTYPDGRITKNLFDGEGRLLARTDAFGTKDQVTTKFTYDDDNRLVTTTDGLGRTTTYTYDDEGRRLSATDPLGRATRWAYDADGLLVSDIAPDGGETRHTYDARDRRIRTTDAAGAVTRYRYDDNDNLTQVEDATGRVTRHEYTGKLRTATVLPGGARQTWTHDLLGRVVQTTSPDGVVSDLRYDLGGRLVETVQRLPDGRTRVTSATYDAQGRRLTATDPLGRTTRWTYDHRGNVLTVTRPDGVVGERRT